MRASVLYSIAMRSNVTMHRKIRLVSWPFVTSSDPFNPRSRPSKVPEDKAVGFFYKAIKRQHEQMGAAPVVRDLYWEGLKFCLRCCSTYLRVRVPENLRSDTLTDTYTRVESSAKVSSKQAASFDSLVSPDSNTEVLIEIQRSPKGGASPHRRQSVPLKRGSVDSSALSKTHKSSVLLNRGAIKLPSPQKTLSPKSKGRVSPSNESKSPSRMPAINRSPLKYKTGIVPQQLALLPEGMDAAETGSQKECQEHSRRSSSSRLRVHVHAGHSADGSKWDSPFEARQRAEEEHRGAAEASMSSSHGVGHDSLAVAMKELQKFTHHKSRGTVATPPSRGSSYFQGEEHFGSTRASSSVSPSRLGSPYEFVNVESEGSFRKPREDQALLTEIEAERMRVNLLSPNNSPYSRSRGKSLAQCTRNAFVSIMTLHG